MTSTVDRLLRPLRRITRSVRPNKASKAGQPTGRLARAEAVIAAFPPDGAPIRPITHAEFEDMIRVYHYHRGRWKYTAIALEQASNLIRDRGLRNALELGVPVRPIIVGADAMDYRVRPQLQADVPMTIHDATDIPWPFGDKQYDLFVALQVFEHLSGHQPEAFLEVRRVARHAIISLPIDWLTSDPTNIHNQISRERVLSWFAPVVPTRILVGNGGKNTRLVFVFEDLPAPG
jgi:hypothetical protein